MRRSARSSSGTAGSGPGSCWRGWRRRSWPGRISWSGWTGSELTGPGSCWRRCPGGCWRCCRHRGRWRWPRGRSRSTWMPPTWRSTATRNAAWPITTRGSGWAARTWPPGPRPRSPWPPTWATGPMTRARPRRICCAARWPPCRSEHGPGGWRCAPARAAHGEHIAFAIGAKRIAPLWRLLAGITEEDWTEAIEMDGAQVAVADYRPDWWPANTFLLVRRVKLDPGQVSADPRSRRRRTLHPAQRALPIPELAEAGAIFRDSKHGAALRHLPSGYAEVNTAWMWGALLAASMAAWLHQLTAVTAGQDIVAGHGVRGGKAMIATLRRRVVGIPGRLIRHARHLILRLPPGRGLLAEILARLRALPALPCPPAPPGLTWNPEP